MAEAVADKEVCQKCGAEVREGTVFCFACGGRVSTEEAPQKTNGSVTELNVESKAALDDLANKLKGDAEAPENKFAKAAEERKKARVTQRKAREFVWEPRDDAPIGLLIAVGIILIAAIVVILLTVVWK
jgi:uncharacterized Zn finger protein (UPF0148 family)